MTTRFIYALKEIRASLSVERAGPSSGKGRPATAFYLLKCSWQIVLRLSPDKPSPLCDQF